MADDRFIREVALSVIERHFSFLQAEEQRILDNIAEAKRSRLRREKLLRLARERNFQFCLEQLSRPGMTLERSPYYGVSVQYDRRTTLEHQALLEERLRAVRREMKAARNASPDVIEVGLRGLLEEAELISEQPPEVRWSVREVELEGVWIGDLEVSLALDEFRVHVWNLTVDTDDKGGYQHPSAARRISSEGAICWGDPPEAEDRGANLSSRVAVTAATARSALPRPERPDRKPASHLQLAKPLHQPRRVGKRRRDGVLRMRRAL